MPKRAPDLDDITLYDLAPQFQERMLKWLSKNATAIEISVEPDGSFHVAGGASEARSALLEEALNGVMHSRADLGLLDPEFQTRVLEFLTEYSAAILVSAADTPDGPGFQVAVLSDDAEGKDADVDFEIALVLAEEKFLTALPSSRLPAEERASLEHALVPPAQREEEAEERHERLRRALMEPRAELEANRQHVTYARWRTEIDEGLRVRGMSVADAPEEYWRTLYLAGFSPSAAGNEFTSQSTPGAWLTENRASLDANHQPVGYARWHITIDETLRSRGMSVSEASPEYWRTLYLAGFSPSDAVKEFTSQTSSATGDFRAAWLTRNRASDEKRIRVAYEVVTPESAGAGDAEDRGWVDEEGIEVDDLVEAARLIQHDVGTPEPSSSQFHKGVWYTGLYNEDYRSGADTFRSYHPYGFTEAEERELYGILTNYRGIHRRRNGERPPPPPRPRHTDTLRHVRRMVREHDKPFDPEAPREHYARSHHFAVNHHDLVGFNEWRGVLEYAETGGPLYYQAPLDRGPELLRPGKNEPYSYEVRARTIRIWPPGSVGRGRNRTSDAFTADAGHLERFSRPGH